MHDDTPTISPYLREWRGDPLTGNAYEEIWLTPPPAEGVKYRVLQDTWSPDYRSRWISRIELVEEPS